MFFSLIRVSYLFNLDLYFTNPNSQRSNSHVSLIHPNRYPLGISLLVFKLWFLLSYATSHLLQIPGSKPFKRCIHIWLCLFRSKNGQKHMIE
ncbi:hypothetical protein HanXRQr2_Chr15g0699481 [Helianthus annuus]|uniref:Uncharacterized protein n=1 Tax=Helianthus annuus TaxID=4232 RepID=A0A251S998_HELAN|nr:hypothetical protein HanXRQr2_Chr15g0699481 [Helianthus annuus]KAJ0831789.1 hypothetical protein HanPSC8_Chr15g0671181 [Helianthus annuus]